MDTVVGRRVARVAVVGTTATLLLSGATLVARRHSAADVLPQMTEATEAPLPAAAPVEKVPVEPPPTNPETSAKPIRLTFDSTPSGADVFSVADNAWLGQTPLVYPRDSAEGNVGFVLKRAGYKDYKVSLSVARDGEVRAILQARRKATPPSEPAAAPPAKPHSLPKNGVFDPFDQ
jgi:hypothetical protein